MLHKLSDNSYKLLLAFDKRKSKVSEVDAKQEYDPQWVGFSFYQLQLEEREKFIRYSVQKMKSYSSGEENIETFNTELLNIRKYTKQCLTKLIQDCLPG
jgi:hypothetical protein